MSSSNTNSLWTLVAKREISLKLRDKGFLLSFAVMIVMVLASFGLSTLLSGQSESVTVAVQNADAEKVVKQAGTLAAADSDELTITPSTTANSAAVREKLTSEAADLALVPGKDGALTLVGLESTDSDATPFLEQAYASDRLAKNAKDAGTTVAALTAGSDLGTQTLEPDSVSSVVVRIAGFVFAFAFFMSSVLFGLFIAQSVVAEKENRIVEILAGLLPIRQLLIGKIAGNTVLAVGQLVIFVLVGLVGARVTGLAADIPGIGSAGLWFVAFYLVGFVALAALWAAAGALATRNEDLQQTQNPVMMLLTLVLFAGIYVPESFQRLASFVPMVNVVAMPTRLVAGDVPVWEPLVSLVILGLAGAALVLLAEKVYRRSLMQTGGRLTMRQALKAGDA
ncbi:ABC transporter permease [Demetria terragena]|uniref:ABC transporter permease n=1 Tax=Demetria terragena TaxID=63959 RepID=UPI0003828886|nr:ABC transporter permease [Demetria terragena]